MQKTASHILRVACPDSPGLVARVSQSLYAQNCNIEEAAQFNDPLSGHFFMRVSFTGDAEKFSAHFAQVATDAAMEWQLFPVHEKIKTLIMVSKEDHCLHDILYQVKSGHLPLDILAVAGNHDVMRDQAGQAGIPFHFIAAKDEKAITALIEKTGAELIVLARYMQILSPEFCNRYAGRIINIHHSFLPGFKGARPYHQAHARGVKIIGATAHFVTEDLDEGPIIEQDVMRVNHSMGPDKLRQVGQSIETRVLRQALEYYANRRIFLHGMHTVIL
ncbi:MAG: formyltetrahydrofolate deformylase [Alphaproteobacteria bacterium]|nr:formyltetrahydrofolate deformylase [Alphaproteobacteria bacterium]